MVVKPKTGPKAQGSGKSTALRAEWRQNAGATAKNNYGKHVRTATIGPAKTSKKHVIWQQKGDFKDKISLLLQTRLQFQNE